MKKVIFALLICIATTTNAQKMSYKVGIMTGLPVNILKTNVAAGSTFFEASKKVSDKLSATVNSGYVRLSYNDQVISQVPVFIGAKYQVSSEWYFGASAGMTIPTNGESTKTQLGYSPFIGYQKGHISVDSRYYISGTKTPISTLALVFSYTL